MWRAQDRLGLRPRLKGEDTSNTSSQQGGAQGQHAGFLVSVLAMIRSLIVTALSSSCAQDVAHTLESVSTELKKILQRLRSACSRHSPL